MTLTKDMPTGDVADLLVKKGVIDSALAFKVWATITGSGPYDAGNYPMHQGQGIRSALSLLKAGQEVTTAPDEKLLLPPGLTNAQIAERVGQLPGRSAEKFLQVVNSNTIRSKYQPPDVTSLEGLMFPDTYFIGATESEDAIAQRLVARFDEIGDKIGLGNAQGLTPYQTVIAASLIQTEAKLAEDAPLISAVIRNRIADGMQLQIDSTLCYAKGGCPPRAHRRRQGARLAVQHLQGRGVASHADRERDRGVTGRCAQPGRRAIQVLRGGRREREARVRGDPRGAQPQRRGGAGQGPAVSPA